MTRIGSISSNADIEASVIVPNTTIGADRTIPAAYSLYVVGTFEIEEGRTLELAAGATLEIG